MGGYEMKDLRKAAKKALNVLETTWGCGDDGTIELWSETKKQLRQALAKPQWTGLTIEEYDVIANDNEVFDNDTLLCLVRDIEKILREKNT
jgi:hypothetical protein